MLFCVNWYKIIDVSEERNEDSLPLSSTVSSETFVTTSYLPVIKDLCLQFSVVHKLILTLSLGADGYDSVSSQYSTETDILW